MNELDRPELLIELTEEAFISMSFGCSGESEEDLTCEEVGVCRVEGRGDKSSSVQVRERRRANENGG